MCSIQRTKTRSFLFNLACVTIACASLAGQTVREISPAAAPEKPVPAHVIPMPFAIDGNESRRAQAVEFRAADGMSARDREVAANAESSIGEQSKFDGLEFNQGKWSYEQVVCTALPEHLFLRFLRNNGTGDVSMFTASIPRGNEGRVRIIPIQLRGYSLFSPAPINAITISVFNHIRAEENPDHAPGSGWLGTGLCYAALAGGHPQLPPIGENGAHLEILGDDNGLLHTGSSGGAVISFVDVSDASRPVNWTMTFDEKGRLLKAAHSKAEVLKANAVQPAHVDEAGKPVPANQPAQPIQVIPSTPSAREWHPIAPTPIVQTPHPAPTTNAAQPEGNPAPQA